MDPTSIVVLEPDHFQYQGIVKLLAQEFPQYKAVECPTEFDLRKQIDKMRPEEFACAILAAVAPWDFPSEDMPVPPLEVQQGAIWQAGIRCLAYIRGKLGENTPICIQTTMPGKKIVEDAPVCIQPIARLFGLDGFRHPIPDRTPEINSGMTRFVEIGDESLAGGLHSLLTR